MSEQTRRTLAKGLVFVGAATLIGNGAAYLLSIVAARILTPADFGAYGALLGILIIISTLSIAVQALTARRVSVATGNRAEVEGQAIRLAIYVGVSIILAGLLAAWPLSLVFAIPYAAVAMGLASLGFVVLGTASLGIAQGREEHLRFSIGFLANGFLADGLLVDGCLFPGTFPFLHSITQSSSFSGQRPFSLHSQIQSSVAIFRPRRRPFPSLSGESNRLNPTTFSAEAKNKKSHRVFKAMLADILLVDFF